MDLERQRSETLSPAGTQSPRRVGPLTNKRERQKHFPWTSSLQRASVGSTRVCYTNFISVPRTFAAARKTLSARAACHGYVFLQYQSHRTNGYVSNCLSNRSLGTLGPGGIHLSNDFGTYLVRIVAPLFRKPNTPVSEGTFSTQKPHSKTHGFVTGVSEII